MVGRHVSGGPDGANGVISTEPAGEPFIGARKALSGPGMQGGPVSEFPGVAVEYGYAEQRSGRLRQWIDDGEAVLLQEPEHAGNGL
jgi:hypothetical protein